MEPGLKHAGEAIARSPAREPTLQERPAFREELKQANSGIARNAGWDPPLHERPEFPENSSYGHGTARGKPGVFVKIVKWLFLVLFGGALAISAVALVTAVMLAYVL